MTVFIVCSVGQGFPIALFIDKAKAHAYVLAQPGRYTRFEIEEMEITQ